MKPRVNVLRSGAATIRGMPVRESAQTAALSVTPSPFSASTTSNWVARAGGLPSYIQNVAKGIMKSGKTESEAIAAAIGIVKRWAAGGENVHPEVRVAAAKALAEWEAKKAATDAKSAVKTAARSVSEATRGKPHATRSGQAASDPAFEKLHPRGRGGAWIIKQGHSGNGVRAVQSKLGIAGTGHYGTPTTQAVERFQRQHGLLVDGEVGAQTVAALRGNKSAASVTPGQMTAEDRAWLVRQIVKTGKGGKVSEGVLKMRLTAAQVGDLKVLEATLTADDRKQLPDSAFAIPEDRAYPVHDFGHAVAALARCKGKPEESQVKAAVYKRWPKLKPDSG